MVKKKKQQKSSRPYATTSIIKKPVITTDDIVDVAANQIQQEPSKNTEDTPSDLININNTLDISNAESNRKISSLAKIRALNEFRADEQVRSNHITQNTPSISLSEKQEAKIIEYFNIHSNTQSRKSTCKELDRLSLEIVYLRLIDLGFKPETVELAMESRLGDDLNSILYWISLHTPISELPEGWSDKTEASKNTHFTLGTMKNKVIKREDSDGDYVIVESDVGGEYIGVGSNDEVDDNHFSHKQWILQNAQQEASDDDEFISDKSDLASESLIDLQEELMGWIALSKKAKHSNDGTKKKECGVKISNLKKKIMDLDPEFCMEQVLETQELNAVDYGSEESDINGMVDLFDESDVLQTIDVENRTIIENPLDLTAPNWSGMDACGLLQEYISKHYKGCQIKYSISKEVGHKATVKFIGHKGLSDTPVFDMGSKSTTTKMDAKNYVSLKALFHFDNNLQINRRLPSCYSDIWITWKNEALDESTLLEKKLTETRQKFIDRLLENLSPINSSTQEASPETNVLKPKNNISAMPKPITNDEWSKRCELKEYKQLLETRKTLPVYAEYQHIVDSITENQIIVLSGSGKSTQIPQFILQNSIGGDKAVNIPRRISAISLADRVSKEIGDAATIGRNGSWVGYQVRNDSKICSTTHLTFCTTGVLLMRMIKDSSLTNITHIIIDEVHERTLDSDFLLFLLRRLCTIRSDLKVILMSATANAQHFAKYFDSIGKVPCLFVPGKTFQVKTLFLEDIFKVTAFGSMMVTGKGGKKYRTTYSWDRTAVKDADDSSDEDLEDSELESEFIDGNRKLDQKIAKQIELMDPLKINFDLILSIIRYICTEKPAGDSNPDSFGSILIFLPGVFEISKLLGLIEDELQNNSSKKSQNGLDLWVLPLHGQLSREEQSRVFDRASKGYRKVVLSTNVAETGITIPDAVYVIDSMRARELTFDEKRNMTKLVNVVVSQANAKQRRGRAGRIQNGMAFHLVPTQLFERLPNHRPPEMVRLPVEEISLRAKSILKNQVSLNSMFKEMPDVPPEKHINRAISLLKMLDAIDEQESITETGMFLASLPTNVQVGKLLINGLLFKCIDPILTVAAILNLGKTPFYWPDGKKSDAKLAHQYFVNDQSDLITYVNAYNAWVAIHAEKSTSTAIRNFCTTRFLNQANLQMIHESRIQLAQSLMNLKCIPKFDIVNSKRPSFLKFDSQIDLHSKQLHVVRNAIACGLYPNILINDGPSVGKPSILHFPQQQTKVLVHSTSVLSEKGEKLDAGFYTYNSIQIKSSPNSTQKAVVWDLTNFSGHVLALIAGSKVEATVTIAD
ncbi:hypothetical protein HDV02_005866 [Globomyces sp. JEL0801]|nr:hypothetical protein HDV02_005866 [Globomyces sp. JEL0801]